MKGIQLGTPSGCRPPRVLPPERITGTVDEFLGRYPGDHSPRSPTSRESV